ncbi:MAG: general secretion pathway protein GspJ [Deltaproteobacteria bacterium]|jgi:general secretion pathway protein J|nr:general secretion pathway protein GspJ [Deltaproteobacteria bacterium]MBW2534106.1 general secretion pathway protein GspJ [Deltaproteobacteria bacterium]
MTLLEVLVSIAIVAMIGTLLYGAFHGMTRSRSNMDLVNDRYQQGRAALSRMARELSASFLSAHEPFSAQMGTQQAHRQTAFIGSDSNPTDRVDFTSFSHRRLGADSHESDQNELSYFAARDPDTGNLDLVRRESRYIDDDPAHGGVVQVLAENIDSFEVQYLDPMTGEWVESWDSTQPAGQFGRLPMQIWIVLVLNGGPGGTTTFQTKVGVHIQLPLSFAIR